MFRNAEPGRTYQVRVEHIDIKGNKVTVEAEAAVTSTGPGGASIDLLVKDFTVASVGQLWSDLRARITVHERTPAVNITVVDPDPDTTELQAPITTFDFEMCRTPARKHAPGDQWTEPTGLLVTQWKVGAIETDAAGTWMSYQQIVREPDGAGGEPGTLMYDINERIRVDDGFIGECTVQNFWVTPEAPQGAMTRISSRRVK